MSEQQGWTWQPETGGGPAQPAAPPAFQPGVVPLRPLRVGDHVDEALAALRRAPATLLGLPAVVLLLVAVVDAATVLAVAAVVRGRLEEAWGTLDERSAAVELLLPYWTSRVVVGLLTAVVTVLLSGVLAWAVGQLVLGRRPRPREAWVAVRPAAGRLLLLTLLVLVLTAAAPVAAAVLVLGAVAVLGLPPAVAAALGVLLGAAALGVAVWAYVLLSLAAPALVLESTDGRRVRPVTAVLRSRDLVRGGWWRTAGVLLLVAVVSAVAGGAVSAPFAVLGQQLSGVLDPVLVVAVTGALGALAASAVTTPFAAIVVTLHYVDRRIRTEGLADQLARSAAALGPEPLRPGGQYR